MKLRAALPALALLLVAAMPAQTASDLSKQADAAYAKKDYARSAELYRQAYRLEPRNYSALYNEACSLALLGKKEEAYASLKQAVEKGWANADHLKEDTDLAILHDDLRWASIVAKAEENAKKNPRIFRKPYTMLPAPTDATGVAERLGSGDEAVWREGDVLSFLKRDKGESVFLSGGIQEPMKRIAGTDLWIAQFRLPDWDRAIVTYGFLGKNVTGQRFMPKVWRGPSAPDYEKATELKGKIIERTIHSDALGEDRKIYVYLPPNAPKSGLPAFFAADGNPVGFAKGLEPLILAGKVRPCAIVGIDNGGYKGTPGGAYDPNQDFRAKEYVPGVDDDRFARHLRFFVDEVGAYVAKEFGISRRREDLAVTGFSNGGAFAAAVAYKRPEAFGVSMPLSLGIPPTDPKPAAPFPRMMFAGGTLESFGNSTRLQYEKMKAEGADATLELYVAGHDSEMWALAFSRMAPRVFPKG